MKGGGGLNKCLPTLSYIARKIAFPFDGNRGNVPPFFQKIEVLNTRWVFFLSFLSDCPKNDGNIYSSPRFLKINQVSEKKVECFLHFWQWKSDFSCCVNVTVV